MKYSILERVKAYFRYRKRAVNAHGIHSPFVYDFVQNLLYDRQPFYAFQKIEEVRQELLLNHKTIERLDYGAGKNLRNEQVADVARNQLIKPKYGELLFKMTNYYGASNILELGTSLGISTSYLAMANSNSRVFTFEGDPNVLELAKNSFQQLQINNVLTEFGNFDLTLPIWLEAFNETLDLIYLDGNHRYEPTIQYFNLLLPKCNNHSIIVLDDIHWSQEMEQAWHELSNREEVSVSIDLFQMGLLFLKKDQVKQHFVIRY